MEYMLHISQKEALTSSGPDGDKEDKDLLAALEASMMDETFPFNQNISMDMADTETELNRDDLITDTERKNGPVSDNDNVGTGMCKTPARKRSFRELGGGGFVHSGGDAGGAADIEGDVNDLVETERNKLEQTMDSRQFGKKTYSKAVKGMEGDDQEVRLHRPTTKEEEEADLQRALELSTLEVENNLVEDLSSNQIQWAMEDTENNNEEVSSSTSPVPGQPEH